MQQKIVNQIELFQALADESRLRIICLLVAAKEEACLCELVDSLLEPKYKLSRHLKILRQAGFLSTRKEGRWVYHRLIDGEAYFKLLMRSVEALPDPENRFFDDLKRFQQRVLLREEGCCCKGIQLEALA